MSYYWTHILGSEFLVTAITLSLKILPTLSSSKRWAFSLAELPLYNLN